MCGLEDIYEMVGIITNELQFIINLTLMSLKRFKGSLHELEKMADSVEDLIFSRGPILKHVDN